MTNVMIVSDNRRFLKSICEAIVGYENISMKLVNYSNNAFDIFISLKPSVIIIDSLIIIPINILLQELEQCRWPFAVFVCGELKQLEVPERLNFEFIEKKNIKNIGEIITRADSLVLNKENNEIDEDAVNYKGGVYFIKPEYYYVIVSKYVGDGVVVDDLKINAIKSHLELIGTPDVLNVLGQDLMMAFKRSDLKVSNALDKVHNLVKHFLSPCYASIYIKKVRWDNINQKCMILMDNIKFSYFLQGESVLLKTILDKPSNYYSFDSYISLIKKIFISLIEGDVILLKTQITGIYIHEIKDSFDFNLLSHMRNAINFLFLMFSKILQTNIEFNFKAFCSIESEFEKTLEILIIIAKEIQKLGLSNIVKESMIYSCMHYSEELSLQDIANVLSISKMHLSRSFKFQTNMTYLEFLQKLRFFIAKELLLNGKNKINEIAEMTGYSDAQYFSKLFKKNVGVSPKDYKNKFANL